MTATFGDAGQGMVEDNVMPALGLSWANLVTTRIMLRKTFFRVSSEEERNNFLLDEDKESKWLKEESEDDQEKSFKISHPRLKIRTFDVIFCPWLPKKSVPFTVTEEGVQDVNPSFVKTIDEF